MLSQAIGALLPAAIAVALSPIPIVAVIIVLASTRARTAGPAFALGWITGLTVVSILVVIVAGGSDQADSTAATSVNWLQVGIGVLFLSMAAKQWRKRPKPGKPTEMPGWMATMDEVTAGKAVLLGLALSAANPKNLALTLAASASIAQAGLSDADTVIAVAAFVVIGSITVAGSVLFFLVAPRQAQGPLQSIKEFMADHNAVIMMIVLLLLGAKIIGEGLGGVAS